MDDGLTPIERAQQAAKARTEASTATAAARKSNEEISNPTNVPSNGATAGGSGGTQGTTPATTDDNSGLGVDSASRRDLQKIPLLRTRAGPRDGKEEWTARLREEYAALIRYAKNNQENDLAWFKIAATDESGVHWGGKCWYYHESLKYEFDLDFEVPVSYPATNPEFRLPQLQGKTAKMYHGGKICLTEHFMPLWNRNVPRFGIAHALSLGLAPWLAAEIPDLVRKGLIEPSS